MFRSLFILGIFTVFCTVSLAEESDLVEPGLKDDGSEGQLKLISPVLISGTDPQISRVDPNEFQQRIKSYSLVCPEPQATYFTAFRSCLREGQQLASEESQQDSKLLAELLIDQNNDGPVWLGGTELGNTGSWIWLPTMRPIGGPTHYKRWLDGYPTSSDECLAAILVNNEVKWTSMDCLNPFCFVCQKYLT